MPANPETVRHLQKVIKTFDDNLATNGKKREELAKLADKTQAPNLLEAVREWDKMMELISRQRQMFVDRLAAELRKK